ncbi:MAG: hypothetical protein PWR02_647 [Synergistales bacterium]|jgi:energy-converting hydrogenase Eha subunit C|nr:hypothetical protein [Synergistales bacterium]MDN5335621.1 hypothetical protein [Synergistales bacterium]
MGKTRSINFAVSRIMSIGLYTALALLASGMILKRFGLSGTIIRSEALLDVGLTALLLTPIATVAICLLFFIRLGEKINAVFAAIVLAVIAIGVLFS